MVKPVCAPPVCSTSGRQSAARPPPGPDSLGALGRVSQLAPRGPGRLVDSRCALEGMVGEAASGHVTKKAGRLPCTLAVTSVTQSGHQRSPSVAMNMTPTFLRGLCQGS